MKNFNGLQLVWQSSFFWLSPFNLISSPNKVDLIMYVAFG